MRTKAMTAAMELLKGMFCTHRRMRYCCHPKNCGHLECPDCGLYWDEGANR